MMGVSVVGNHVGTCANAIVKGGGKALEHTTSKGAAQRRRGAGTLACGALAATTTAVAVAHPARASAAPPPTKPAIIPILSHEIYVDKQLIAPTKSGRILRRRKGSGGSGDDGDSRGDDGDRWNLDNGDNGGFNGGGNGDDDSNGGNWNGRWGGGGGGDKNNDGSGNDAGESGDDFEDEFYRRVRMRGVDDRGVMWLWQTLCAATLAGSVQHALERGDRLRLEAAARLLNPAESCAAAAQSMERAITPTVRLANASAQKGRRMALTASITRAHLSRQPFAAMAGECAAGWH
ncbi:low complexity orphan protein [Micromonas commoda]|uniref:Low complexity orphan protein n=1 Tax=Micromonas commoda (strain RCC299 / NOUM17 / CCMP2709) TaxID=296587 RepID=C1FD37_MICCC|nr:low complexity orphan protein [Micromonas commoda]ACO68716.1 low complexity orphan protein [Micromonas commoda]|eukprot:XP_002507458.1 low complexity orphan protein [Micromonas commoda]